MVIKWVYAQESGGTMEFKPFKVVDILGFLHTGKTSLVGD